jgi:hypothetical protein
MNRENTMTGKDTFTDLDQIIVNERNTKATATVMTRFRLETMPSRQYEAIMGESSP